MLFILGRGRSGTSLLSRILNQHECISIPPEGCFIRNCHGRFKGGLRTPRDSRLFVGTMMSENRMKKWDLNSDELTKSIQENLPMTFQESCEFVIHQWAVKNGNYGATILADKNPHYSLWAKELGEIFPKAKFVHIIRNPFDNIASFQNVRFDINDTIGLALRWKTFNEAIFDAGLDERCFVLRYEELVETPEETVKRLCTFLDLEYSDQLLHNQITEEKLSSWHQNLSKPVNNDRVGYGLGKIKPEEANASAAIVARLAGRLGYEVAETSAKPGFIPLLRGRLSILAENNIYRLPLKIRSLIINSYRKRAGSI